MTSEDAQSKFNLQVIPVTALQQNAMIFWSSESKQGVLIDPGGEVDRLLAAVDELGISIVQIWLTHGHIDHVGGAAAARRALECEIIGPHPDDQWLLDELEAGKYGIEEAEPFSPDRYLQDGDTAELDGLTFQVLHCPGHSPGHVVFYQPELAFAFMGDVLFKGSIGRTDLPRGNHEQLIDSIVTKLWPLPRAVQFVPGHGPASTLDEERRSNAYVADSILSPNS
jgi:glyoxylase-like metal-dependent hydrolase (beta-lactamase superfamily II)